ncbi:MAG: chromate transporter [Thermosipho sp. (in: thermotogales)]|nr:chromate transporter [Thermosipho sp. (in: thermotogales)]
MRKKKIFSKSFEIFYIFFSTALLALGGGYAMVPVFQKRLSKYINEDEFLKILSVAQSVPGPIAINIAIMLGEAILGVWGSIIAVIAVIIPPVGAIVLLGSLVNLYSNNIYLKSFFKGIYGAILGLILGVLYSLIKRQKWNFFKVIILLLSIFLAIFYKNFLIILFVFIVWWCYHDRKNC